MKPSERSRIASLGGKAVSGDRAHMARIGRKGGEISGATRRKKAVVEEIVKGEIANKGLSLSK